jgi:hypothetical protein
MIPTFRSMIVATLLSLMALIGGFGLFAAFRVNHEPLAQLPTSATPFTLANNDAPPHALSFASEPSFGSRLESNAALVAINTASMSGDNVDSANAVRPPSAGVAPDSSTDSRPATTAAVDTKTEDASQPAASTAADPKTDDASPPGTVAEIDPKADSAAPPPVAAMEVDPKADSAEPPQPDASTTAAQQTAAVEPASDQANNQAAIIAPAVESIQPESTPPAAASPGTPAPTVTAAITPTAAAMAMPAAEQVTAGEITKRKRLAAARRAHRARVLTAAQTANQNSLFPQANFQSPAQTSSQPVQQAAGGPFAPAPAKARRQN